MTVREYLKSSLQAFDLTEATFMDIAMASGTDLDANYNASMQQEVGKALICAIEQLIFAPRLTNVSENGFSQSWDYANLGKYYLWLCRRWGVRPNADTVAAMGMSTITDRTGMW